MHTILFLTSWVLTGVIISSVKAQTQQIPLSLTVNQNGRDTVLQAISTITTYSDSATAVAMNDTAYLRNLSGTYRIDNGTGKLLSIEVNQTKTLLINLPDRGQHELVPIIPIYFKLKNLPLIEVLIFTDRFGQVRGLDIIDKQEPKHSLKRQIGFTKQGTFRN